MSSTLSNGVPADSAAGAVKPAGYRPVRPRRSWLTALLLLRCPRCREGRIFRGTFAMNPSCPVCGLLFQREAGYFLGAMYTSYALGTALLVPLFYLVQWLLPSWPGIAVAAVAMLPYLVFTPSVFRYSRGLWIYMDRYADPGETSHSRK
jgi:uncharacterized protein (DUF983 family)